MSTSMHLLVYVLTTLVFLVPGTDGLTVTGDDTADAVADPLSFDSLRAAKNPTLASSLPKPQKDAENKISYGRHENNEERMFSVPSVREAILEGVERIENAVNQNWEHIKNTIERITSEKLVEEKKIMEQEKVSPLQHDELRNRQRHQNDAESSVAGRDHKSKWSSYEGDLHAKTAKLTNNVINRMTKEKLVVDRSIINQGGFVQMLREELQTQYHTWDYEDLVESLTRTELVDDLWLPHVKPEDLMEAFHSLRSFDGMHFHADSLQKALAENFQVQLVEKMFHLWLDSQVTPFEAHRMWMTDLAWEIASIEELYEGMGRDIFNREIVPMVKYINAYRSKYGGFSDTSAQMLMQEHIDQAEKLGFLKDTITKDWLKRR